MSCQTRKPTSAYAKTKMQISFAVTAKLISAFVFYTRIVQFLYFQNPKFPALRHLLCLYSLVCVRSVRKSHCWFSHVKAQICTCKCENNDADRLVATLLISTFCKKNQQVWSPEATHIAKCSISASLYEPPRGKTNNLPRRKQRRRSASQ